MKVAVRSISRVCELLIVPSRSTNGFPSLMANRAEEVLHLIIPQNYDYNN